MDLATFAQVVSAIAVLVGLGFAVTEVRRHRERKSRESTLALVQTFQTPEIAQALIAMVGLPAGLSKQELDDRLGSDTRLISLLMTTWESVGILLCRREIDIRMVEDFFGGPIVVSWRKLKTLVFELRARDNRDTYFEWFQWLAERMLEREAHTPPVPAYIEHKNWRESAQGRNVIRALAILAVSATSVSAQTPQPARLSQADSLATWYALGLNAHHLCAGLWVVGRDYRRTPETVVAEDIARFPAFRWESDFRFTVDTVTHTATVTDPQTGSRSAKYSGDQGCTILPASATEVFFAPKAVRPSLPAANTQDWPTGDRNAHARFPDVDSTALGATLDWAFNDAGLRRAQHTRGVVVIYRGKIIAERYAPGWGPYTPQLSWSMGKSIAATLIGVLIQQKALDLNMPAPIPEWRGARDPRREIKIADLLRMSSGLDFDNFGLTPATSYTAANEHFRIYFDALDVASHAVHQPARYPPGTVWRYRNSDPLALMYIAKLTVDAKGEDALAFPQRQLFDRIGARSMVLETDAWGNFIITGFDFGGSRDWARLGLLYLRDGVWQGQRILPEGWSTFVSTPAPGDRSRGYGGLFWLNRGGAMPRVPEDAYWAAGYMGQYTMVIPSRDVVIVRQGPSPGGDAPYVEELVARILAALPPSR